MKKIFNKKGFTLVELLLVIAIIGILAAVLFVSLGSQRERARVTAFKESMRSIVPAAQICTDQNGVLQPAGAGAAICAPDNDMDYPAINQCTGGATTLTFAAPTATGDNWNITSSCARSGALAATPCVASCSAAGCTFTPAASCN